MLKTLLESAGFVENTTYRETRFLKPPSETYAVYHDDVTARGTDEFNCVYEHRCTVEIYEYAPDKTVEGLFELALDEAGIEYEKQRRYWLDSEQLYQVIYEFTIILKGDNEL